jgi:hypothetical protein
MSRQRYRTLTLSSSHLHSWLQTADSAAGSRQSLPSTHVSAARLTSQLLMGSLRWLVNDMDARHALQSTMRQRVQDHPHHLQQSLIMYCLYQKQYTGVTPHCMVHAQQPLHQQCTRMPPAALPAADCRTVGRHNQHNATTHNNAHNSLTQRQHRYCTCGAAAPAPTVKYKPKVNDTDSQPKTEVHSCF